MHEPKRIISLMHTAVWEDILAYFKELFGEYPERKFLVISEKQLLLDMHARFDKKYDAKAIAALLHNGYELAPGVYTFNRQDFTVKEVYDA